MNWRERVFWEEGGPELASLSAPTYMGLSPTLMGGGMLVYSNAEWERLELAGRAEIEGFGVYLVHWQPWPSCVCS